MTKYRGFRKDGKGWIEGYYIYDFDMDYSSQGLGDVPPRSSQILSDNGIFNIHPESLAISTGLTDKNGKEIFGSIDGSKGGDVLTCMELKVDIVFEAGQFVGKCKYNKMTSDLQNRNWLQFTIIGNQYETQQEKEEIR